MPHQTKESSLHPSSRPERFDAQCKGCGEKIVSTDGRCPNGCLTAAVRTSPDEMTKKVVDDNDLFKGGLR